MVTSTMTTMPLTVREYMALTLESRHFKHGGARITAIRSELGWSEVRQAQVIAALIRTPEAEATSPALVHRLRRLEQARRSARSA